MKVTYRIPGEMYAFVEVFEESDNFEWTPEQIRERREILTQALAPRPINELPPKEWDTFIENWLLGENNHTETVEKMSPQQKQMYNTLKRAKSRINSKLPKDNE